ncbi:hypothetical protein QYM36_010577 [Artemia franciscana]|uniref:HTH CENPB-type domain-containing protein n=1 Tax=Artemia franciscana TaxID=6661 RepID=A0AA88I664_ARTSF|nr:hypothetical protein QYM36_010577 [Artemia franciscana]
MKAAVMAHLKDGMPIRTAATLHAVQKSTLSRYCKTYSASADEEKVAFRFTPRYDVKKVFSSEMEDSLESYILLSSRMNYRLTKKQTKKLAWEFAKANTLKYPKSWDDNEAAGEDWYKGFMERHTRISLRRLESTSLHCNLGFNRAAVDTFYKHLEELQSKFHFPADRIYNMDETGLLNVQQKCRKVLSLKGVKQLGATTSQERGKLVTMVGTINAMGSFIPPYLIFGRTRFVERLLDGAPPGTKAVAIMWDAVKKAMELLEDTALEPIIDKGEPSGLNQRRASLPLLNGDSPSKCKMSSSDGIDFRKLRASMYGRVISWINESVDKTFEEIHTFKEMKIENVRLVFRNGKKKPPVGTLYLTTTHLIFVDAESRKETWITLPHIGQVIKLPLSTVGAPLQIRCKTFLSVTFIIVKERDCHDLYVSLTSLCQPVQMTLSHLTIRDLNSSMCGAGIGADMPLVSANIMKLLIFFLEKFKYGIFGVTSAGSEVTSHDEVGQ